MINTLPLINFTKQSTLSDWNVVNDGVMGGRSQGEFYINQEGHATFTGFVSLENSGGFTSVRHRFQTLKTNTYDKINIRLKGDGNRYQFRTKTFQSDRHAYITYFETTGEWQTIEISLHAMYPTFRGQKINLPNFAGEQMEEIAFLIANKKAQNFRLEIDSIELQ
ncbi:CIA30 family protein [Aquimarina addita]|uniref:CIA30 family protein n=2 Tax=Aquimarina addita TaxID=870485 RepID=A0ABP6US38_9FLAO